MFAAKEVFTYFLKLGLTGFGGPLALIASMQEDLVIKRRWLTSPQFVSAFSLIKAMPGPIAFSTAVYLGRVRAGFWGALLAGTGLVFPAFVLVLGIAYLMDRAPEGPAFEAFFLGLQISAFSVIVLSLKGIFKGFEKSVLFWTLAVLALGVGYRFSSYEPLIIIGWGLISIFILRNKGLVLREWASLPALLWTCFKGGAFVFGSGLAIVPMLESDVVQKYHWMTSHEFLNALAVGQSTPGPVVITATFIGYHVQGFWGALLATIAIFLASFFHMSTWFPRLVDKLSTKSWIPHFTLGAVAAVIGTILSSLIRVGSAFPWNGISLALGVIVFILGLRRTLPAWALIPLGGIAQLLLSFVKI